MLEAVAFVSTAHSAVMSAEAEEEEERDTAEAARARKEKLEGIIVLLYSDQG